ncbi:MULTISPECIES: TIR domain-containing protein [Enterobacteriaceae]|uniref:TIR domain-containing protein n=1 Tax=Enterobacteriaceae TaxID=543 RepID=UPI0010788A12|nr:MULTISPECIES: nucleotide-binding protein [Enterobacteriaceae]MCW4853835.1 nucleotide-binding protein [Enterobacter hormaechei subsp. xiangfangensis]MCW4900684.1 nucleotide-binding protein [Enterobacter hormaechei subsp. xiangfangensis]MCW4922478.1 nucleotide-binding protein [Enterobacter hormaechei subsp. xiangfangensis]MCW4952442.1 nucleotide-binding protein [Enterobacter hormaechei subsp. xiangfangensis]MCW4961813.1 nucleotide-binding protein [Enterobacter hormaechei subsp. xiangfangensis
MNYYHIIVETIDRDANKRFIKIIECDRTDLEEIKSEVIKPYSQKKEVYIDGAYLKFATIRSLKIKKSDESSSELTTRANNNIPDNVFMFITAEDVISGDGYTTDITRELIKEVTEKSETTSGKEVSPLSIHADNKKVFVVHGQDNAIKSEMARFLDKAGLEPIILHEQASSSNTIIEKIEANSDIGYAVVLYTPCDIGARKVDNPDLKSRARQNVVFEHGYFIGRLGRSRVSALLVEGVEAPNDISGVVYIDLDTRGAWKIDLAKELIAAGYNIDSKAFM